MADPESPVEVAPDEPTEVEEVLVAQSEDPGEMAEISAEREDHESAETGSTEVDDADDEDDEDEGEEEEDEKTWVEFKLLGVDGEPVSGENVKLVPSAGDEEEASTGGDGKAKAEDLDKGTSVRIHLVDRFDHEWKKVGVEDSASGTSSESGS